MDQHLIGTLSQVGKTPHVYHSPDGTDVLVLPYGGRVLGLYSPESDTNFFWTTSGAGVGNFRGGILRGRPVAQLGRRSHVAGTRSRFLLSEFSSDRYLLAASPVGSWRLADLRRRECRALGESVDAPFVALECRSRTGDHQSGFACSQSVATRAGLVRRFPRGVRGLHLALVVGLDQRAAGRTGGAVELDPDASRRRLARAHVLSEPAADPLRRRSVLRTCRCRTI